jgi:hypothetical protein
MKTPRGYMLMRNLRSLKAVYINYARDPYRSVDQIKQIIQEKKQSKIKQNYR